MPEQVVVVGAGLAGARSCQELRAQGYTGAITLLGAETHLPYDRPPLSKQLLLGELDNTTLAIDWAALDIGMALGRRASGLRPGAVETDSGDLACDAVVLATGSRPVTLPGPGKVLRTVDDAVALRTALRPGARLVVVGAGWIGAEVATAGVAAGCHVVVLEAAPTPLAVPLGEAVGALVVPWYAAAGIELRTGVGVVAVEGDGVVLAGGELLPADVVVVGIGARPETEWLRDSGLPLDPGVVVDASLSAGWPGVVAVGDIASWWSPRFRQRLRVEHWDLAMTSPAGAAATLLGRPAVYDPVPYFWSDQLGQMVQFSGHRSGADRVVHRGDPAGRAWSVCWLEGEQLVAVLAVNGPRDNRMGRKRIALGSPVDEAALADPAVPIEAA
ncbi:MAG: FAD-dependent oxidoreductase [Actinomycetota bacterium]|nr:FAD-dependent oxidoreductase [Actinomycetota bacterium]